MRLHVFRLLPGQDLKKELAKFTSTNNIEAACIVTVVGSLTKATLRLADESVTKAFNEKFEIVSCVGTLSPNGLHIHVSLSGEDGKTIGGHLKDGCTIYTTAEVVIAEMEDFSFSRELDARTGCRELRIHRQHG